MKKERRWKGSLLREAKLRGWVRGEGGREQARQDSGQEWQRESNSKTTAALPAVASKGFSTIQRDSITHT